MTSCPAYLRFGDAENPASPYISTAPAFDEDKAVHVAAALFVTPVALQDAICRSRGNSGSTVAIRLAVAPAALQDALQDDYSDRPWPAPRTPSTADRLEDRRPMRPHV